MDWQDAEPKWELRPPEGCCWVSDTCLMFFLGQLLFNVTSLGKPYYKLTGFCTSSSYCFSQFEFKIYLESKKYNILVNIITKKKQTHRYKEQTSGYQQGEGRREGIKRYKLSCIK